MHACMCTAVPSGDPSSGGRSAGQNAMLRNLVSRRQQDKKGNMFTTTTTYTTPFFGGVHDFFVLLSVADVEAHGWHTFVG